MAFNLEFKITYDELAPSLQDMFKSLQGQITDNRNEITNINLDISDITNEINNINNHLTQIDNSITNIENNIDQIENNIQNIENDITNIEGDITEINKNITNIEGDITNIQGDISNIEQNITQIEGDITNIQETVTVIQGMTADGEQGQVVKIDKNAGTEGALFADDNFHEMLVFETDEEIENFKNQYDYNVSMQEIFDTWQVNILRDHSGDASLQEVSGFLMEGGTNIITSSTKDVWQYNSDAGTLVMTQNNSRYSMFISTDIYQANLDLEIMCIPIDGNDDDVISIIFGYKQPNSSEIHTLQYMTTPNHNTSGERNVKSTALCYDFCQTTYKYLVKNAWDSNLTNNGTKKYFKMKVNKTRTGITCARTICYNTENEAKNAPYYQQFTYTLPSTKPSDWTQEQYNNIQEMFGESKIGYGTFSWNSSFKVLYSNTNLNGSIVYNLNTDTYQSYKDGVWITASDKVSDIIPYRVFLYNDYTDTLFFYYYKQTYCKIATSGGGVTIGTVRYVYVIEDGWIEMNGQLLSRSVYNQLYNWAVNNNLVISDTSWNADYVNNRSNKGLFSYGDGSTTFRLPDFRARFIRGLDNNAGFDTARKLGTEELPSLSMGGDDNWSDHDLFLLYNNSNIGTGSGLSGDRLTNDIADQYWVFKNTAAKGYLGYYVHNISGQLDMLSGNSVGAYVASRPRNIALHAVIRYK